jgi:ribosome recycling factor
MSDLDLNAPEVQDAIKKAVEDATLGLKNKNNELIGELRKAKKDSVIDPDDYNRLKDERDSLQDKLNDSSKLIIF